MQLRLHDGRLTGLLDIPQEQEFNQQNGFSNSLQRKGAANPSPSPGPGPGTFQQNFRSLQSFDHQLQVNLAQHNALQLQCRWHFSVPSTFLRCFGDLVSGSPFLVRPSCTIRTVILPPQRDFLSSSASSGRLTRNQLLYICLASSHTEWVAGSGWRTLNPARQGARN